MCSVNFSFTFDMPVRHVQFRCDGCQEVEVISETGQTHVNLHSVQLGDLRWVTPKIIRGYSGAVGIFGISTQNSLTMTCEI